MPLYKKPQDKATETATFRLTRREKQLLHYLAQRAELTATDWVRLMIAQGAAGLDEQPDLDALPARRKPGRPKKKRATARHLSQAAAAHPEAPVLAPAPQPAPKTQAPALAPQPAPETQAPPALSDAPLLSLGDLIAAFRAHFATRSEGTRAEFEEAIGFFLTPQHGAAILDERMPLHGFDAARLTGIRERMRTAELRFPRKNLYLTYLRMLFQFALRQGVTLPIVPTRDLAPLTAKEVSDAWPAPAPAG